MKICGKRMILLQEPIQSQCVGPHGVVDVAGIIIRFNGFVVLIPPLRTVSAVPLPPITYVDALLHDAIVSSVIGIRHVEMPLDCLQTITCSDMYRLVRSLSTFYGESAMQFREMEIATPPRAR